MREIRPLNFDWKFGAYQEAHLGGLNLEELEHVDLPHHAVLTPFNHFDEKILLGVFTYYKELFAEPSWKDKTIKLYFEGVLHRAHVYVNGHLVGAHDGGYTPFEIDIKDYLHFGEINPIIVVADSDERQEIPPFGGLMDYLGYAGIYREVELRILDAHHITAAYVESYGEGDFKLHVKTSHHQGILDVKISSQGSKVYHIPHEIKTSTSTLYITLDHPILWDINHPHLYDIEIIYKSIESIDTYRFKFGIRKAEFITDGFYLNGQRIKLIGLNRHQSYPYVGYAMPKHAQVEDADILKYQLGLNIVRTSHYPQSRHFLDRCDEIGLLVFEEIPGWQHIGDEAWQNQTLATLKEMIERDRNHPSIILWGTRINESPDHHDFYLKTSALAKQLDPTRQRGGVRNLQHSEFLEDVYTYNDFSHTGKNPGLAKRKSITKKVPYLVTEYNGHMFPTKRYDDELKRIEHMKRHLNVMDTMMGSQEISGAIGWCMNDYNTHQEFGSGDRVCYHGVLDMYRIPKLASLAYSIQQDETPMLEVTSTMNIGEYPSGNIKEIYVMTNLDEVKLYKNDVYIGTYFKDTKNYPHLKHAPIIITDLIGETLEKNEQMTKKDAEATKKVLKAVTEHGNKLPLKYKLRMLFLLKKYKLNMEDGVRLFYTYMGGWGTQGVIYRFEGYKNKELVKVVTKENNHDYDFILESDEHTLSIHETYDVKRYVIKKVNQHQEIAEYAFDPLDIKVYGALELIGPSLITLTSGVAAFWVKTKHQGEGQIIIESSTHTLIEEVEVL
jgi:beta-galactosidase